MTEDSSKKIKIDNHEDESDSIEVKKSQRFSSREKRKDDFEDQVSDFYKKDKFNHIEKPLEKKRGGFFLIIVWALLAGLIGGTIATFFIFSQGSIDIPLLREIDSSKKNLEEKEPESVVEKNVTVLEETRVEELIKEINQKTGFIYLQKDIKNPSFLEQIYAPWQRKGIAAFVNSAGWLITGADLDQEENYLFLASDDNLYAIQKIVTDPMTKISFFQINGQDFPEIELAEKSEINSGKKVMLLSKLNRKHFTEIDSPEYRNIYQTEDLVQSTDRFSSRLVLDMETSLGGFPQGLVFGLDGKIIGIEKEESIIPCWQVLETFKQVLLGQEIRRPFLGIDYLRISQAPGLQSERFKSLKKGAIVYGDPLPDSPALKEGVQNADVILEVDDVVLEKDQNLTYLVQQKKVGEEIKLTILREGQEIVFRPVLERQ